MRTSRRSIPIAIWVLEVLGRTVRRNASAFQVRTVVRPHHPTQLNDTSRQPRHLYLSQTDSEQPSAGNAADEDAPSRSVKGGSTGKGGNGGTEESRRAKIQQRVSSLARNLVIKPIAYAAPMPSAIASVLKEATLGAVDMAVDEVIRGRERRRRVSGATDMSRMLETDEDLTEVNFAAVIDEAFAPLERSLDDMERALTLARKHMKEAKSNAMDAIEAVQAAAMAQATGAATAVAAAEEKVIADIGSSLSFDDVDFSDMAPPFLDETQCLVPGEPVVRLEKAPENSRRIFAGVDIMASVDDVWKVLTDYSNLQKVVPNLVVNEVLELYDKGTNLAIDKYQVDPSKPAEIQCKEISKRMKGALLRQVGGAKVAGINFSARTKLEVREWPDGMPDFAHFNDEVWEGKSRQQRAKDYSRVKLQRYSFPRPFAISSLPTKDISMQSIVNDDGEFRMYQGVWRLTPLPGCAPPGKEAMRLTYAVEVSPRAYLPVQLIEGRIVRDLCTNLEAIRDFVSKYQ
jgi:Polyketide cyclase / dehydrase and lipid transport